MFKKKSFFSRFLNRQLNSSVKIVEWFDEIVILEAAAQPVSKERCIKLVSVLVNMNSNKHTD